MAGPESNGFKVNYPEQQAMKTFASMALRAAAAVDPNHPRRIREFGGGRFRFRREDETIALQVKFGERYEPGAFRVNYYRFGTGPGAKEKIYKNDSIKRLRFTPGDLAQFSKADQALLGGPQGDEFDG